MSGVYYLIFIIAILLVIQWYANNEQRPPEEPTRGLFAMRDHKKTKAGQTRDKASKGVTFTKEDQRVNR